MKSRIVKFLGTLLCFLVFSNTSDSSSIFKIENEYDIPRVFDEVTSHFKILSKEISPLVSHALKKIELSKDQQNELFSAIKLKDPYLINEARKSPRQFLQDLKDTVNYVQSHEETIRYYLTTYNKCEGIEDLYSFLLKELLCIKRAASLMLAQ